MPLLFCNIAWMREYRGHRGRNDQPQRGGRWVEENETAHECCNFLPHRGVVFGHVESLNTTINIERLGALNGANRVEGIDVIWVATHDDGGRRVVGWYRNATVYRDRVYFNNNRGPTAQHRRDEITDYRISASEVDIYLIPEYNRNICLGRGKGWFGRKPWWYADNPNDDVEEFLSNIQNLMNNQHIPNANHRERQQGRGNPNSDPLKNAKVEAAAITKVIEYYTNPRRNLSQPISVTSREADNVGWDLDATTGNGTVLNLEVKGLSGNEVRVGVTPNEYRVLRNHINGTHQNYRLCVVINALSENSRLYIFRYKDGCWRVINRNLSVDLAITEVVAAIISLNDE